MILKLVQRNRMWGADWNNLSQNKVNWQVLVCLYIYNRRAQSGMDDGDIVVAVGGKEIFFSPKPAASFGAHPASYSKGISHPIYSIIRGTMP